MTLGSLRWEPLLQGWFLLTKFGFCYQVSSAAENICYVSLLRNLEQLLTFYSFKILKHTYGSWVQ